MTFMKNCKYVLGIEYGSDSVRIDQDNELSIDWFNGRRTPDANILKCAITRGLGNNAPRVFRS